MDLVPTPSQTAGPFFHLGLTTGKHSVRCIAGPQARGERVWLSCSVLDGAGQPVSDAMIEVWQADSQGRYHSPGAAEDNTADPECLGFGRLATDQDGRCEFETIKPGCVPGPGDASQAPHVDVALFARGLLKQLFTRMYFAGDPSNEEDYVLNLVPEERRSTLMAQADTTRRGHWHLEIHLQGERETVFFDV